jgi:hypothetical protein
VLNDTSGLLVLLKDSVEGVIASFGEINRVQWTACLQLESLPCVQTRSSRGVWWFRVKIPDIMLVQGSITVVVEERRGLDVSGQSLFDLSFQWCEIKRWEIKFARQSIE